MWPTTPASLLLLLGPAHAHARLIKQPQGFNMSWDDRDTMSNWGTTGHDVKDKFSSNNTEQTESYWAATFAIRSGVSREELLDNLPTNTDEEERETLEEAYEGDGDLFVATYLDFQPENEIDPHRPMDDSWAMCINIRPLFGTGLTAGASVDMDCGSVLGDECIAWLLRAVSQGQACRNGSADFQQAIENDSPCSAQNLPDLSDKATGFDDDPAGVLLRDLEAVTEGTQYVDGPYGGDDDSSAWDDARSRVWLVLAGWGRREEGTDFIDMDGPKLNGTIMCVSDNKNREDDDFPPEDAATRLGGALQGGVMVAAVVGALLTFTV